jgi:hypothetical protein
LPLQIKEEELAKGGGRGGSKNIWRRESCDNLIGKLGGAAVK